MDSSKIMPAYYIYDNKLALVMPKNCRLVRRCDIPSMGLPNKPEIKYAPVINMFPLPSNLPEDIYEKPTIVDICEKVIDEPLAALFSEIIKITPTKNPENLIADEQEEAEEKNEEEKMLKEYEAKELKKKLLLKAPEKLKKEERGLDKNPYKCQWPGVVCEFKQKGMATPSKIFEHYSKHKNTDKILESGQAKTSKGTLKNVTADELTCIVCKKIFKNPKSKTVHEKRHENN